VTQSTAQANCHAIGGRLALVSSAQKLDAIQAFILSKLGPKSDVWVDGSDAAIEGAWRTSTGDIIRYIGWTGVEPNGGTSENCITLRGKEVKDEGCDRGNKVIAALCEPVI